jgi:AraC-like DNA-binding protein
MGGRLRLFTVLNIFTAICIAAVVVIAAVFYKMPMAGQKQFIESLSRTDYPIQMNLLNGLFTILIFAYFATALRKLTKYFKSVKAFYSDIEKVKYKYAWHLIILLLTINIALGLLYLFMPTYIVEIVCYPIIVSVLYMFIIYYAFHDSAILTAREYNQLVAEIAPMELHKKMMGPQNARKVELEFTKSSLSPIETEEYYNRLVQVFDNDKLYLDPSITLAKLSEAVKISSNHLSLIIKIKFNTTFFDLINSYRIKEAQKMLKELDTLNITIEGLAFNVGFNSRSAFYRAFKKYTKLTPTEYLAKIDRKSPI